MIKEKRGIINTMIRQLISEKRLVNGYIDFVGLFIISNFVFSQNLGVEGIRFFFFLF